MGTGCANWGQNRGCAGWDGEIGAENAIDPSKQIEIAMAAAQQSVDMRPRFLRAAQRAANLRGGRIIPELKAVHVQPGSTFPCDKLHATEAVQYGSGSPSPPFV